MIGFGAGEPDFDTPDHIKEAAIEALRNGKTKYSPVPGIPELREAIAEKLKNDNDLDFSPEEVIVSTGGKHSLYNLFQALVNPGDEVLFAAPYWVSYKDIALLAGGRPVILQTSFENDFKLTAEALQRGITAKTKVFLMNSPSNPAGVFYDKNELEAIVEVLRKFPDVYIITDDIYEKILYDGEFVNIPMLAPDMRERCIVVNGLSKAYSMTGWRLGYTASHVPGLIKAMSKLQGQSTSGATTFSQYGGVAALRGDQACIDEMRAEFRRRRDFIVSSLNQMNGIRVSNPRGAFYVFPDISELAAKPSFQKAMREAGADSVSGFFAEQLLAKKEVALVPGNAFGYDHGFRLSYAIAMEQIQKGLERIHEFVNSFP